MEELIPNFEDIIPHSEFKPEVKGRPLYVVSYVGVETSKSLQDDHFSEVEIEEADGESDAITKIEAGEQG